MDGDLAGGEAHMRKAHERVYGRRVMPVERRHPQRENLLAAHPSSREIRASTECVVVTASGIASLSFIAEQFSARTRLEQSFSAVECSKDRSTRRAAHG
jgi:hypothetical protein